MLLSGWSNVMWMLPIRQFRGGRQRWRIPCYLLRYDGLARLFPVYLEVLIDGRLDDNYFD